jgi:hypothetical protein
MKILVVWALALLLIIGMHWALQPNRALSQQKTLLGQRLLLTDLCLSTESRHTRNVALPETIAPFQDFAGYHEHFPSSSFFWYWK